MTYPKWAVGQLVNRKQVRGERINRYFFKTFKVIHKTEYGTLRDAPGISVRIKKDILQQRSWFENFYRIAIVALYAIFRDYPQETFIVLLYFRSAGEINAISGVDNPYVIIG